MRFSLTNEPIKVPSLDHDSAGGFVTFEGKVRNHADGLAVIGLEYEAYAEMATEQGEALLEEAAERFGLLSVKIVHRIGKLQIGDTAVVVQVASAHRREAFEACEWIMDQLKWRVPIWKRETYANGVSDWVSAGQPIAASEDEAMFERQMRLPEVGKSGQLALANAKVLLVGAGGLASGCLPSLVGAGVGTIGLVDPDTVDISNLHRQTLFAASDVGRLKVERAMAFAKRLRPSVRIQTFPEMATDANAEALVGAFDWIVDGTDSLATKFLLNRVCKRLEKPLVTASVYKFEGQLMTVLPGGPCLESLFPEIPPDHCVGTCAQSGVLGVVPCLLGLLQANEVIKGILGLPVLGDQLALIDLLTLEFTKISRQQSSQSQIEDRTTWDLARLPHDLENFDIVDIRELHEVPVLSLRHKRFPMMGCYTESWNRPTIFVCASGSRSYRLAADLRAAGSTMVYSLQMGVDNSDLSHD
jgi:adenylyltransferase/sulfurtransferase